MGLISYCTWKLIIKTNITYPKIIISGILNGTISHYLNFIIISIILNILGIFYEKTKDIISVFTMLKFGYVYTFFSLLFFGTFTVLFSILIGLFIKKFAKQK